MAETIKVVSLNCFGAPHSLNRKSRFKEISNALVALNPHIITLQEVYFKSDRNILIDKLENIGRVIYTSRYFLTTLGGLITITKLENKLVSFTRFKDQGPIALLPIFDRLAPKGFQHILIQLKNKSVDLINVHTLCVYRDKSKYLSAFENQIEQLKDYIDMHCGHNIILAGDLNAAPSQQKIVSLKKTLKLNEYLPDDVLTVSSTNTNRKGFTNIYSGYRSFRTDYILTTRSLRHRKSNILFDQPVKVGQHKIHLSDHYGIVSEFGF